MDQEQKDALHREMIAKMRERVRDTAPELLEALVQLHTVAATVFPPENEKVPGLWREAIENARAAIKKATGN